VYFIDRLVFFCVLLLCFDFIFDNRDVGTYKCCYKGSFLNILLGDFANVCLLLFVLYVLLFVIVSFLFPQHAGYKSSQ